MSHPEEFWESIRKWKGANANGYIVTPGRRILKAVRKKSEEGADSFEKRAKFSRMQKRKL
jgi:hypothetical protein